MTGKFTGRHMAAVMVAFFGVVIAVNVYMAELAGSTFGGVVVDNSYVASQDFNGWLDEAARERNLGWRADVTRRADGRLSLALSGTPSEAKVSALARHPLGRLPDRTLNFARGADGSLVSTAALPAGRWRLRIDVEAAGHSWRAEKDLS